MYKITLKLALICLLLPSPALAETYSCTDGQGVLHVADNLMKLPAECRDRAKTLKPQDSDRVNFVAPPKTPPGEGQAVERAIRLEEQALAQKKKRAADLVRRAETVADNFREAVTTRKAALRSKSYGNRNKIVAAEATMKNSRKEKQEILKQMGSEALTDEQRQRIKTLLDGIED